MPLLRLTSSKNTQQKEQEDILLKLSKVLASCLKKPENYVQTIFINNQTMTFGGSFEDSVFIEIKSIGSLTQENCKILTQEFCTIAKECLGIDASKIYVEFQDVEASKFGWNNSTFG